MAWFKVDDKLHSHPKVIDVPLRAMGLWVKAGAWCSDHLTDGVISKSALRLLGGSPADARALVDAGLWEVIPEGWRFHDWSDMNPSRKETEDKREQERVRKAEWREQKAKKRTAETSE